MTEIRSINGINKNELSDRGLMASGKSEYIPYLSLTKGEMLLYLQREQAKIYAAAYPEFPEFKKAVSLIDNSLNAGVSRGVNFIGALDTKYLQDVARIITKATKMQQPAAKIGLLGRDNIGHGIGDIPVVDRYLACMKKAGGNIAKIFNCQKAAKIEEILNDGIIKSGHHVLYKNLKIGDKLPVEVSIKANQHKLGVEGMALAGELDSNLMYDWVETAILKKNVMGKVGPLSSRETAFVLGGRDGIGIIDPITATFIISLVSAALGGAAALLKALRSEKAYAMAEAKAFGTKTNSPNEDDWDFGGETETTGIDSNTLLIGGAAVAAYFLLQD